MSYLTLNALRQPAAKSDGEGKIVTFANNLISVELTRLPRGHWPDDDCPVCLLPFQSNEPPLDDDDRPTSDKITLDHKYVPHRTQCGHIFHLKCIYAWTNDAKTCPFCRANMYRPTSWRLGWNIGRGPPPSSEVPSLYNGPEELEITVFRSHENIDRPLRTASFDYSWGQLDQDKNLLKWGDVVKRFRVTKFERFLNLTDDHKDGPLEYTVRLERYA
jgi:hypothetical protein